MDIHQLLRDWPFDPSKPSRIVHGEDGREILQIRLPLGIEQYELDGRPDGARPHARESLLDHHVARLAEAKSLGQEERFVLSPEQCAELFTEGTLYYFRYLHLFQLHDWPRTIRDTSRNIRLFDFVHRYADREEDQMHLEKWRPYILRMNAVAEAMFHLDQRDHAKAGRAVREAIERIEALEEIDNETFHFEQQRSLIALREVVEQVEKLRPVSAAERLERELQRAIEKQEFERAAELRDRIRDLRKN